MNSLPLLALLALVGTVDAACCNKNIVKESSLNLFNPPLQSCPSMTTFVCSFDTKMIVINEKSGIADSFAELYCIREDWVSAHGTIIDSIRCA